MVFHTNFKGQKYVLHVGVTKNGKPKYFFSLKTAGRLASEIPDGYVIHETPNGQVFLRKVRPKTVTDREVQVVRDGIQKYSQIQYFKIDLKGKAIVIFIGDDPLAELTDFVIPPQLINEATRNKVISYSPVMRFVLTDKKNRLFAAERFCYLGAIDDWIEISNGDGSLKDQVQEFVPHLGEESFFEL